MSKTVDKYIIQVKTSGTKDSEKKLSKVDKAIKKVGSSAKRAAKVGMAVLGAAMVAAAGYSLKTAKEFEALKTRLNTLYGSLNAGTQAFNTFNQIASTTPFALKDVVEAGASLKAFGLDAEENIKGLSDLAAFMGVDIVTAAGAMGRAFAGGAGAADVFRDRGVLNIIKMREGIDDLSKVSLPEFRRMMKEAIEDPSTGIAGATDALAQTFTGRYSNMMDSVDKLANAYGEKLLPIAEKVVSWLGGTADAMSGAENAFDVQIKGIQTGQAHLKTLTENLKKTEMHSKSWKIQMSAIRREYPEFLQGIRDEDITLGLLNDKLANYNDLSEERIAILEKEKKKAALLEKQAELIKNQSDAALDFANNLMSVDDTMGIVFEKAKHKIDLSSEAGANLVSELARVKRELGEQEDAYLAGDISAKEFYSHAVIKSKEYAELLQGSRVNLLGYNSALKSTPLEIFGQQTISSMAIAEYIGDIREHTENLTKGYQDNNTELNKMNAQYGIIGQMIKQIDDDLTKMTEGEDEGLIPPPSKEVVKQYDKQVQGITKIVNKYQSDVSKINQNITNAELALLEARGAETMEALQAINNMKVDMLEREQEKEITALEDHQNEIMKSMKDQLDFAIENNLMTEEEQAQHKQDMKDLETQFSEDMINLKTEHGLELETLNTTNNQSEFELRKETLDDILQLEKDHQDQLDQIKSESLQSTKAFNNFRKQTVMDTIGAIIEMQNSSQVKTIQFIKDEEIFRRMQNAARFDAEVAMNDETYENHVENLERTREATHQHYLAKIESAKAAADADGKRTELEQHIIDLAMVEHQDWVKTSTEKHHKDIEKAKQTHGANVIAIKNKFDRTEAALTRQAKQAEINLYVDTFSNVAQAFADNAGDLFNMNKTDKKRTLQLEQAIALGMGYKEIAGIWAAEPQGLKGVPVKTALTISAGLRTAGNVARIQQQIEALDQVPKPDAEASSSGGGYQLTDETAAIGYSGIIDSPTNLLVGEAGQEMVNVTPLDGREEQETGVVVNVTGNVMSKDYVEGELAEAIKEAVRRGSVFGL
tara:strand:- start:1917 stop:5069 length:3153 start_codon:yes stop_codon:yes gene_type:complete